MEPARLTSRRLSSSPRTSRPLFVNTRLHRPGSSGSVEPGEAHTAAPPSSPSPGSTVPSFPLEGVRDGHESAEHTIDNSEPDTPESGTSTPSQEQPAQDNHGQGHSPGHWLGALGAIGTLAAGLFVFFALLGGQHHHHGSSSQPSLSAVGMPTTLPGNIAVKPLRIAVVLGGGLSHQAQRREMHTLESWLSGHVNPATRLTILDPAGHTTTPALRPSSWTSAFPGQRFQGATEDVLKRQLQIGRGHRLIVTFDHPDPLPVGNLARLHLTAKRGAALPEAVELRPGKTVTEAVDPAEIHAFANTTAKAVISISNMTEGEET